MDTVATAPFALRMTYELGTFGIARRRAFDCGDDSHYLLFFERI